MSSRKLTSIRLFFDNGSSVVTSVKGSQSEIQDRFIGKTFNLQDFGVPVRKTVVCKTIAFLDAVKSNRSGAKQRARGTRDTFKGSTGSYLDLAAAERKRIADVESYKVGWDLDPSKSIADWDRARTAAAAATARKRSEMKHEHKRRLEQAREERPILPNPHLVPSTALIIRDLDYLGRNTPKGKKGQWQTSIQQFLIDHDAEPRLGFHHLQNDVGSLRPGEGFRMTGFGDGIYVMRPADSALQSHEKAHSNRRRIKSNPSPSEHALRGRENLRQAKDWPKTSVPSQLAAYGFAIMASQDLDDAYAAGAAKIEEVDQAEQLIQEIGDMIKYPAKANGRRSKRNPTPAEHAARGTKRLRLAKTGNSEFNIREAFQAESDLEDAGEPDKAFDAATIGYDLLSHHRGMAHRNAGGKRQRARGTREYVNLLDKSVEIEVIPAQGEPYRMDANYLIGDRYQNWPKAQKAVEYAARHGYSHIDTPAGGIYFSRVK